MEYLLDMKYYICNNFIYIIYLMDNVFKNDYSTPYWITHLAVGGILAIKTIPIQYRLVLLLSIIIYQLGQYYLNVRLFIFDSKVAEGNSLEHTINKLQDYLFGFCIILILTRYFET